MLWLGLVVLTIGAMAAIVVPLLRSRAAMPPREAFDRAVYRDQLAEIARDVERGVLDGTQADAARLEVERRVLATAQPDATPSSAPSSVGPALPASGPVDGITAVALASAVAAGAVALYLALGSPNLRDEPLASRQNGAPSAEAHAAADIAASVDALAARLKEKPGDAKGWLLLARSQASLQRWQDSAASYQHAMALTDAPEAGAGYGEMLVMAADGMVTPAARDAFAAVVTHDPGNAAARFYLALGDAQEGKAGEALAAWTKLVDEAPPGTPWLPLVRQHMEETARQAGIALPPDHAAAGPKPAGPSAADIEAAQAMTPEARQAMIHAMVDRLAAQLEANPNDEEGWRRLARAYTVLGDTDKAQAAAERAAALAKPPK
jgi:cytochrome c-type biogenesis protein CcmH